MKKVGIVLYPYGEKNQAGLGEYIYSLAKSMVLNDSENEFEIYLKGKASKTPDFANNRCKTIKLGFGSLWRDLGLLLAPKADIYIFNTPILPLIWRPKKSIVVALDFAYYFLPAKTLKAKFNRSLLFKLNKISLRKADQVVAISDATRDDVIKLFKIAPEKVRTIYPGFTSYEDVATESPKLNHLKPFFFFVGVIKDRKNVLNIAKAFIKAKKDFNLPHKLIIAGKGGGEYLESIKREINSAKLESEVIFVGRISNAELADYYRNAEALVFPSLFEGFGFPLLEAMSAGLPIITSNTGALSEVAGNVALKVDPMSVEAIASAMRQIATDDKMKADLKNSGLKRSKEFSWQRSAKEFINLISEI